MDDELDGGQAAAEEIEPEFDQPMPRGGSNNK